MLANQLRRWGGWAALANGIIGAPVWAIWLGRVFLFTKVTEASASTA
jgi:hypothetical protein